MDLDLRQVAHKIPFGSYSDTVEFLLHPFDLRLIHLILVDNDGDNGDGADGNDIDNGDGDDNGDGGDDDDDDDGDNDSDDDCDDD